MNHYNRLCEVWFLEDFWHVHMAIKQPVDEDPDIYEWAETLSRLNPTYPIRFTCASPSIVWFWKGEVMNPFGPCSYSIKKGKSCEIKFDGFDPNTGFIEDSHRLDSGGYRVKWDPATRYQQGKHMVVATAATESKTVSWLDTPEGLGSQVRPGWELLAPAFHEGAKVRYHPFRQTVWASDYQHLGRLDETKPTSIMDDHVFEKGSIGSDNKLQVIRLVFERTYKWAREIMNVAGFGPDSNQKVVVGDYHRSDGPAVVTVYNVRDTIRDDSQQTHVMGTYQREFWRNNRIMTGKEMEVWSKSHGVILIDHPCHDRPAFPNEMDRATWVLTQD